MFEHPRGRLLGVSPAAWVVIVLMFAGIGIRLFAWRPYLDRHAKRYSAAPPRGWLWTPVDDPEVERWRRIMVVGSILAIVGSVSLFALAISGFG